MHEYIGMMVSAVKILKSENPDSKALIVLEDALKKATSYYICDMAIISNVVPMDELEKEMAAALKMLQKGKLG